MKTLIALSVLLLSGCGMFSPMGVAKYEMEPVTVDGVTICCKVKIYNTKDIGLIAVDFEKSDGDYRVSVTEAEVNASTPLMIQSETNAKMADTLSSMVDRLPGVE